MMRSEEIKTTRFILMLTALTLSLCAANYFNPTRSGPLCVVLIGASAYDRLESAAVVAAAAYAGYKDQLAQ